MLSSVRRIAFSELSVWLLCALIIIFFLFPFRKKIRLGLDLAGGTFVTLSVHADKAVEHELADTAQAFLKLLKKQKNSIPLKRDIDTVHHAISLTFSDTQHAQDAAVLARSEVKNCEVIREGNTVTLRYTENTVHLIKKQAVEKNVEILRVRLDQIGVAETPISIQGANRIVIELPDVKDPEQAKAMIGAAVNLELRLVEGIARSQDQLLDRFDGELPSDKEIIPSKDHDHYLLTSKYAEVTGRYLKDAQVSFAGELTPAPVVVFTLTKEGGGKLYELTSKNIGRELAIVLDGVAISWPRISTGISDTGSISGGFTLTQAKELALLLKSGSFVAPVSFEEERQIGPALGAESIRQGFVACAIALILIFFFCLAFYSVSGIVAFITLIYNLILVLFGMSQLGATLTLPGIAGMVLTVGMAVDASILIFEHIREALAHGDHPREAMLKGFSDAFTVIFDANITTFLVGVVLYFFATGPLQGFAVTMMLGILATLITGLGFQRALFSFYFDNFSVKKLRI